MKRLISILIVSLMLVACLVPLTCAAGTGKVTVTSTEANVGEQVTVTVSFGECEGLASYGANLTYDTSALKLVSMEKGDFCSVVNAETGFATHFSIEDAKSGTLFTATFEVIAATSGEYKVGVVFVTEGDATCNAAGEAVAMTVTEGVVKVTVPCTHANTEIRDAKEPTCTEKGYTGDTWCKDCETKIADGEEIAMKEHTPAEEKVGVKSETCAADGYTGDVICSVCKTVIQKGEVVKATGKHVDENKDNKCDVCQKDLTPAPSGSGVTIVQKPVAMYFNDVLPTDWFYEDVLYVYTHGLMVGVSDTHFAPAANLTRGMLVTILYRMEGEPAVKFAGTFGDVADGLWYSDAVEWAAKNDIVKGYETGNFGPNDAITREQLATILYRYAKAEGYNVSAADDLADFSDAAQISEYAVPAMKWAVASGLLKGADGKLMPRANATRAEVAALIHRFDEKF